MPRKLVHENLLNNGDFELAPAGTVATNVNNVWVDGTAAGSSTNDQYKWATNKTGVGTASALFDTSVKYAGTRSLKLAITVANATIDVRLMQGTVTVDKLRRSAIWVNPSTQYTISFRMKTNYTSGDATEGARLAVVQYDGAASALTTTTSTAVKTTTDWTQYSFNITTQSGCRFLDIRPRLFGTGSTANLIMDAWFDDIQVKPTTVVTRQVIS